MCWTIFSRYLRPKDNDQWRGKKKRPAPTATAAGTCLSVVNIRNASKPKVPRHLHLVSYFQVKLEADKLQICKCHLPNHVHPMWQTVRRQNKTCPWWTHEWPSLRLDKAKIPEITCRRAFHLQNHVIMVSTRATRTKTGCVSACGRLTSERLRIVSIRDKECGCSGLMCSWQHTHDTLHDLTFHYKL